MGTTLNAVEPLQPPFQCVDEQVFVTPLDGCNDIPNRCFKIVFMLEGHSLLQIDEEPRVPFAPGDVVVIPRACRQRYWTSPRRELRRLHALRLVFDPAVCPPFTAGPHGLPPTGDPERDFTAFVRQHLHDTVHLPGGQDETIRPLLTELRQEAERRQPGYRFRVSALCLAVVVQLVRQLQQHAAAEVANRPSRRAHLALHVREFLLKNLDRALHLDEIAQQLTVSPEHLARTFKQETGQTVFYYLQQLRLEKAKTFLIGSDKTVSDIATLTGYSSLALFSRTFKRHVGASPLHYRQQRWEEAVEKI
ncbi:MAG: helix-turn-helix transcriptional regulator [Planctomycetia bacterium]|nr:helix-turn-helix transcriptional regulator [Planctomycetia bacterium]